MDYKNTLNLPQTDFSMKANLSVKEPQIFAEWEKEELYHKIRHASKGKKLFILHDGPPYANGRIHIGHALNKILKDVIIRYKTMRGFDAPYIPGWDCHGLPVEHQLFKDLGKTKDQVDQVEFRRLAGDYAMKYVGIQREEFKRLGIFGEWDKPYLTLDKDYEHAVLKSFASMVEHGFVYRGLKPVNWCIRCETALAEAEVEYNDHVSDSVFVKFELKENKIFDTNVSLLIWTTTPWTLIANVAVAVHPDLSYVHIITACGDLIIAEDRLAILSSMGINDYKVVGTFKGRELEGLTYEHPFGIRQGSVVLADYVSKEDGTGCVHTAPGHGQDDFQTGLKYSLEVIMPVNERGLFNPNVKDFAGQHIFKANEAIIQKLKSLDKLVLNDKVTHTYPHCWRCKSPIIFRATQQWFLKIDHKGFRQQLLEAIHNKVQWIPASGRERISAMVEGRPDWCLSRQRYWGVPIPAIVCLKCHTQILDKQVIDNLAKRVVGEGTDAWFKAPVSEFLPQNLSCSCGSKDFGKANDILDVWFDSGVSHQAVLKNKAALKLPADLYLEGSDQHRGWFQSSLIASMAIDGNPPFETVLTHGFVVDNEGRKMSKTQGNVVAPQDIVKEYGADILRLWVLSTDYNEDVRISKEMLVTTADGYRKIRNTVRFLLSNLNDFFPDTDRLSKADLLDIDKWALHKLDNFLAIVTQGYETYGFYHVFKAIYKFCNEDMSSLYLDILKDRLYTAGKKSKLRRSAQTVLYDILKILVRILAPVIPFTAEEIYRCMIKEKSEAEASVHLLNWPQFSQEDKIGAQEVRDVDEVLSFRPAVLKHLEEKRAEGKIGSSLEARVTVAIKDKKIFNVFERYQKQLPFIFIVSQVEISLKESLKDAIEVNVDQALGQKCARCWNYSVDVDANSEYPGICSRCVGAISS